MKKYFFSIAVCVLVLFSLEAQTVAVFDFDCEDPDFAGKVGMMTDLLIHELVKPSGVTVVERKNIDKVFSEYSVQATHISTLKVQKSLGKVLEPIVL